MPEFDRISRTSLYIAVISIINLTFLLSFLDHNLDSASHPMRASVMIVIILTLCNWIAATLPFIALTSKNELTSGTASCIVAWHVLCLFYGIVTITLMALPALQTVQCCIASIDDMEGITKDIDFDCPEYTCNYFKVFILLPFLSIVWSTFTVHYQVHNVFRFLHERQQEQSSYDRLIQRLTTAHREGVASGSDLNFNLDGIILANETRL
mmetsp:Transcript_6687/g.10966  ORF Transcript_6687/g.10966 Transcript_6687/m.10966 type:complete len:210 (+) Transcript_6687:68-697(+)